MVYKGNMSQLERQAAQEIPARIEAWLGVPVQVERNVRTGDAEFDLIVRTSNRTFVFEVKGRDDVATLERAYHQLRACTELDASAVPVLVVPFMGPTGREWAEERGLAWMDLSGNADVRAPGVRVLIEGKSNLFTSPGRPSTAFSPKGSRLARVLLADPGRAWRQVELVRETGLSPGYVSKVVGRLLDDGLLARREDGAVDVPGPGLLLDAWAQHYDFRKHEVLRYHMVGRTGLKVLRGLAERLGEVDDLQWAATGLAAAWLQDGFADFRLVSAFVSRPPAEHEAPALRRVDKGENVWLIVPSDEGVFHGVADHEGVPCVLPVQTWLDLAGHPERSEEAAEHLRASRLTWSSR